MDLDRGCAKKNWWNCVGEDVKIFNLSHEDAQDKDDCKL